MREMRLNKRKIEDREIIREILEECDVVRLGIHDEEGMFIVPVNFGYDFSIHGDIMSITIYIHGAKEGRKAEAFLLNPEIAVEMDCRHGIITGDYSCGYSFSYRSIMGNGQVRRVDDEEEKCYALSRIMKHMAADAEIKFSPEVLERTAVFRIDIEYFTAKERKKKER